jgi:hypothetical protein
MVEKFKVKKLVLEKFMVKKFMVKKIMVKKGRHGILIFSCLLFVLFKKIGT